MGSKSGLDTVCLDVIRLIEDHASAFPDTTAVTYLGESVTYLEINRRANRLAHWIRRRTVATDAVVAVSLERGVDLLVAFLGILKAGAAYLPLDECAPPQRIRAILQDARPMITLRHARSRGDADALEKDISTFDTVMQMAAELPSENLIDVAPPTSLAYVMYTSGTSGHPKGVLVTRASLTRCLRSVAEVPGFRRDDTLLAVTNATFDISILELLLPLIVGGRVLIADRATAADGKRLTQLLGQNVSVMQATPTTWRMLLAAGWRGHSRLRAWCGGEMLQPQLVEQLASRCGELWNLYGPTESTIWATVHRTFTGEGYGCVGFPLDGTTVHVLDGAMEPVPAGVVGEVYLGGSGVARGYLGAPRVTAERFRPDPFSGRAGTRLYATGDLGRWRSDGALVLVGRRDQQVKVRGHRIEVEEIEAVLSGHPDVRECAVAVHGDRDPQLVAYLVTEAAVAPEPAAVRAFLLAQVPSYMVPARVMVLPALPRTSAGKLNRRALPPPAASGAATAPYVAPESPLEVLIANGWGQLLGLARVGRHDNFFELGGHSLLATQCVARLRQTLHLDLPLSTFFRAPTVAELAHAIRTDGAAANTASDGAANIEEATEPVVSARRSL